MENPANDIIPEKCKLKIVMNSTLFTLAVILPSIRLKIAFRSIPSGTYGWKGGGTLSFELIPLCLFHQILVATDMYKLRETTAKAQTYSAVIVTLNPMILW